jgi:CSLREA domain-containing protein
MVVGVLGLVLPASAGAAVFKPTRHDDPAPGKCKPHDCSLREALIAANAMDDRDTVVLGTGTYKLQIPPGGTPFQSGALSISNAVTLRGEGPGHTRIDAEGLDSVITIGSGIAAFGKVALDGLALQGGDAGASGVLRDSEGGGIFAAGEAGTKLVLRNVVVRGNTADFGGGIFDYREGLLVRDSTIRKNTAVEGGGIHVIAAPSETSAVIHGTTIVDNAAQKGGGLLVDGSAVWGPDPPTVDLLNTTLARNHASADGGGIMDDNNATVTLNYVTIADNAADVDGTGGGAGGGVYQHSSAIFGLGNSIIAKNAVGASGVGPQCDGSFEPSVGAVIESQLTGTCSPAGAHVVDDALIGSLGDHGGPTETIKLKSGSPAIGFGHGTCPRHDQRGIERPLSGCDSGSFERSGP